MSILPTALRYAKLMAWLGLGCGVLYAFGGLVVDLMTIGLNWGTALAFLALLGMPALFAAAGFAGAALLALAAQAVSAALHRRRR